MLHEHIAHGRPGVAPLNSAYFSAPARHAPGEVDAEQQ